MKHFSASVIILQNSKIIQYKVDHSMQWTTSESNYQSVRSYKNWMAKVCCYLCIYEVMKFNFNLKQKPENKPKNITCTYMLNGVAGIDQGKWTSDAKCGEMQHYLCEVKC